MPNLKDIKVRITSVQKTRQITSAMKLVAAAKLKGATDRATAAQPYQRKLGAVLRNLGDKVGGEITNPLLQRHEQVRKVLLVLLTTDRGLCGGFNNNLLRRAQKWVDERQLEGVEVSLRLFGRKGRDFCRVRGMAVADTQLEYAKTPKMDLVRPLSDHMVAGFTAGDYDEVWIGFNVFVNAATQRPEFHQVLPLSVHSDDAGDAGADAGMTDYLFEPSPQALLESLLPLYLRTLILQAFLETEAGEHGARMLAMDNATRNATDLIGRLTLEYNRARQAAITTEITEIVSGAEAL
ncbi:MAG: ATP synthase F1 subunit gamma [Alphaproteobacteria bacterium]|nr:ATP synthase F1 subunit gamma [Alphaproteobacteria bacterium]